MALCSCTLCSRGSKPSVDAESCVLISPTGEIFPEEVAQAVEPAQVGGHLAFLARDLLGGVINAFISGVPELTVLAWRSSIFSWQCWKSN